VTFPSCGKSSPKFDAFPGVPDFLSSLRDKAFPDPRNLLKIAAASAKIQRIEYD